MNQQPTLPELPWPKWHWKIERWSYVALSVIAVIPFLIPDIPFTIRIVIFIVLFIVLPFMSMFIIWIVLFMYVAYRRLLFYPKLYESNRQKNDAVISMTEKNKLITEVYLSSFDTFSLYRVSYYKGKFGIFVVKHSDGEVKEGYRFLVIDRDDLTSIGLFQVEQIRPHDYYATAVDTPDPLWLGYIIEQNKQEAMPPPNSVAVLISRGEK